MHFDNKTFKTDWFRLVYNISSHSLSPLPSRTKSRSEEIYSGHLHVFSGKILSGAKLGGDHGHVVGSVFRACLRADVHVHHGHQSWLDSGPCLRDNCFQ